MLKNKTIILLLFFTVAFILGFMLESEPGQTLNDAESIIEVSNDILELPTFIETSTAIPLESASVLSESPMFKGTIDAKTLNSILNEVSSNITESSVSIVRLSEEKIVERGSGVVIDEDESFYYILTNYHMISDDSHIYKPYKMKVYVNQFWTLDATYVGHAQDYDLAVLKIAKSYTLRVATFADTDSTQLGDLVFSVGTSNQDRFNAVNMGIVSGTNRYIYLKDGTIKRRMIQHDAVVNPGYSGGGLFDISGNLIGINTAKLSEEDYEGVYYAVPMETITAVLTSILNQKTYQLPTFGVTELLNVSNVPSIAYPFGQTGAVVYKLLPGYGTITDLEQFDLIVQIDDYSIDQAEDVYDVLLRYQPGDKLTMHFVRDNIFFETEVTLTN